MAKNLTAKEIDSMIANEVILEKDIVDEMRASYLVYSIMTIIDRALPDVRDGLKPVQRRILYSMLGLGILPGGNYRKSARIIGDVIGKYHPHGDTACYGAMANLVNDFDVRYPIIDGQGNFGSVDGDSAAAMRYTEAKLRKIAVDMLADINKDTVNMLWNFSEDELEPEVLPGKIPYLLVNGASGIATGYTTDIPSHNLIEICNGIQAVLKNPDISVIELVKKYIKGPDLASRGFLIDDENILKLYETGEGKLSYRGKSVLEKNAETGNYQIVIEELPPGKGGKGVNKKSLIVKIHEKYVLPKQIKVVDLRDESEGKDIRIVLELHKTVVPEIVMDSINKTILSTSQSYVMRAIVDQAPAVLNLKELINHYIAHRRDVVYRRTKFELVKMEKRQNILNGFDNIKFQMRDVVNTIMDSNSDSDAKNNLINIYGLNMDQANAVMERKLSSLTKIDTQKIESELAELNKSIQNHKDILNSSKKLDSVISNELNDIKKAYGDERKTQIIDKASEPETFITQDVTIVEEPKFITITNKNQIKTMPYTIFEKSIKNKSLKEKTNIFTQGLKCNIDDTFILILSDGNYIKCDFTTLTNDLTFIQKNQKIISILLYSNNDTDEVITLISKKGYVKKIKINLFKAKNLKPTSCFEIEKDDEIIGTRIAIDNDTNAITLITKKGLIHRFYLKGFSATSQTAKPLGCIKLDDLDEIVDFDITDSQDINFKAILFSEYSSGKTGMNVFDINEFVIKNRMAKGSKAISYSKKNVGVTTNLVMVNNDFFMIDNSGTLLPTRYSDVEIMQKGSTPKDIDFKLATSKFLL